MTPPLRTRLQRLLAAAGALAFTTLAHAVPDINGYYNIGYMPSWQGDVNTVDYDKLTHINYAFAVADVRGNITVENTAKLQNLVTKARGKKVKVLISVGGWNNREDLGKAIHNAPSVLIDNLVKFMQDYQLDGIDIDWEYPDDTAVFTTFMRNLKNRIPGKLLTAALSASDWGGGKVSAEALGLMDYAMIMAYDNEGEQHSSYDFAQSSVQYWRGKGMEKSKLILGVPFYGYKGANHDMGYAYKDILASDPSASQKDYSNGIYYNGIPTIQKKTELAMAQGLGVMNWELSQDAPGQASLLSAIHTTLGGGQNTSFTITANAGSGGTITPSGSVKVQKGADQTFAITADPGRTIDKVVVDGATQGALSTYTFTNVQTDHTITASFLGGGASNLALNRPATASSQESASYPASGTTDGSTTTRWASEASDPQWISVDLGTATPFNKVVLRWESAYAKSYQIQVSHDNQAWTTVLDRKEGLGGVEELAFDATTARYVRMYGTARATTWGYSLWEFEVYHTGTPVKQYTITASAGANGTISPSGPIKVNQGANQTFNLTPAAGYQVGTVLVDGSNVGAVNTYTFSNVQAAHTIQATFVSSGNQAKPWAEGVAYSVGALVTYGGQTWKCTYAHTSLSSWYPGAPGLWFWVAQKK